MADLIDRQLLLQVVDANISHLRESVGGDPMLNRAIDLVQYTRDFIAGQTAVDAIEVVRCKDCKHIVFSDCYGECGKGKMGIVSPDDYCSYGERKEK